MKGLRDLPVLGVVRSRRGVACALAALLCVFCLRVYNLDCDLPSWGISLYTSLDEGSYAAMALNRQIYGRVNCEHLPVPSLTDFTHRNNVIGNAATYLSLKAFGDNYLGLRLPSVLWALGTLLLMFLILRRCLPEGPRRPLVVLAALAVPVVDFQFLMASRVVEPSVVRMFFVTLLVALLTGPRRSAPRMFLVGFISVAVVMMVYVTTIFIMLPVALFFFVDWVRGDRWKSIWLAAGMVAAFILGEAYYNLVWQTSFIANVFFSVTGFAKLGGYSISVKPNDVLHNIWMFVFNRTFLYSAPLLALTALALPGSIVRLCRRQFSADHVILSFIVAFCLQTLAVEDYVARKFIVIYPLSVLYVALALPRGIAFWKGFRDQCVFVAFGRSPSDVRGGRRLPFGRIALAIGCVCSLCLAIVSVHYQIYDCSPAKSDFRRAWADRIVMDVGMIAPLVLCLGICCRQRFRLLRVGVPIVVVGWLMTNVYFSLKYVFFNNRHDERDFMMELGRRFPGETILGEWAYAYTLYNDIKPVEQTLDQRVALLRAGRGRFLLDYEPKHVCLSLYNEATLIKTALVPDQRIRHSFTTLGDFRDHVLYRAVPFSGARYEGFSQDLRRCLSRMGVALPHDKNRRAYLPLELCDVLKMRVPYLFEEDMADPERE